MNQVSLNNRKPILLVEDTEEIQEIIRMILEDEGYTVEIISSDGELMVKELTLYSLLIIDAILGGSLEEKQGIKAVQLLRVKKIVQHLPIMVCSAHVLERELIDVLQVEFLAKPFEINELCEKVAYLLAE